MMKVYFTDEARDFMYEKKSNSITIDIMSLCGCTKKEAFVSPGKPATPDRYDFINTDLFEVYIYKGAESGSGGITIFVEVEQGYYGPNKSLGVTGLVY